MPVEVLEVNSGPEDGLSDALLQAGQVAVSVMP